MSTATTNLLEKMKKKWKYWLILPLSLLILLILGLLFKKFFIERGVPQKKKIARVFDQYLYNTDLQGITNPLISKEDSTQLVNYHVESWVRRNLMVAEAENTISTNQNSIEQQLQDYRESLLLFLYEKELLKQSLDTLVTDEEIETYYQKHKEGFKLRGHVLKAKFVIVRKETPQQSSVKQWMKNPDDQEKLQDYCYQYALNFSLTPTWYTLDKFTDEIPIQTSNTSNFLKNNKFYTTTDENNTYFVWLSDYGLSGNIAPLDYKKQDITKIIVNKRKLRYVKEIEDKIYQKALNEHHFEIY